MSNLKPGQKVGRYTIIRELGSGGFGVTYLADSEDLEIKVAVKEYFPEEFAVRRGATVNARSNEQKNFDWGKKRFLQEARTLAKFRNPNIVGVRQIFEQNNTAYMVLDYESGRNLKAWRKEINDQPTEQELIEISRPLLAALEVIHSNDLLHRDISPDNIIIRNDGTPVLIDFGSSRSMVQKTRTVSAMVKSGYSPPELYTSLTDSQGPWSDIYSYAATVYFLITGKPPEEATNRLIRDNVELLADTQSSNYSREFLEGIDAALSLKAERRPQNVREWEAMLGLSRSAAQRTRAFVPPVEVAAAAAPSSNRNTPAIIGAVFVAILVVGGLLAARTAPDLQQTAQPTQVGEPTPQPVEAEPAQVQAPAPVKQWSVADLPSTAICTSALNVRRTTWDNGEEYADKVAEARRRGLSVADCRTILGLTPVQQEVPAQQPASNGDVFGAIAYSNKTFQFQLGWGYTNKADAERTVLADCNRNAGNCVSTIWFSNACGAAARGPTGWGTDWGETRVIALQKAMKACAIYSRDCKPAVSVCTPPDGDPNKNFQDYEAR